MSIEQQFLYTKRNGLSITIELLVYVEDKSSETNFYELDILIGDYNRIMRIEQQFLYTKKGWIVHYNRVMSIEENSKDISFCKFNGNELSITIDI